MVRVLLELLRIIFIFALIGGLLVEVLNNVYSLFAFYAEKYSWIAVVGIYILLFVLYRNKLQFSGWYTGKGGKELPTKVSELLIGFSILLIILPVMLSMLGK